uniref:Fatty-acid amide hydrolase 1 n=1 Tax=Neogobius melanostomus TaxID=47308 RepID=A0A8C6U5G1_9GOBI
MMEATAGALLRHWPEDLVGAVCLVGAVVLMVRRANAKQLEKRLTSRAQNQREHSFREAERAVLKYKQSHPTKDSTRILRLSLCELMEQLQDGSLSAEEVLYAYMEKTLELQRKLNCCTGIILDSFEQCKTISSCKKGLLYGVPISLKENLCLKNQDSSCGLVKHLEQPAGEDAVLVKVLKKNGAIPFVRTNVPQGLLSYKCSNPIYGETLNPHNVGKTCGGSSGGEAALIGGGASVMGVGSDLGGSLRVPASFCGICSLKPTAGRLSSKGLKSIQGTAGPLAKDVESLAVFMKAVLCDDLFSLDPTVPPLPFNEEVYRSRNPLTIGYYDHLEQTATSPSMIRAVREVKALLERAGHTLVPYRPVRYYEATELMTRGVFADGGATFLQKLNGSTIDPIIKIQVLACRLPMWLKKLLAFILKPQVQCLAKVFAVADLWKLQASLEDCVSDTITEWKRLNIDVVLCPSLGPAFSFVIKGLSAGMIPHASIYNGLNFSAGVVPVSTVTAQDESDLRHLDKGDLFYPFKEAAAGGLGLPVAVQCVALPWQDELCLRFMKEVEELVQRAAHH